MFVNYNVAKSNTNNFKTNSNINKCKIIIKNKDTLDKEGVLKLCKQSNDLIVG